MGILNVTPDSFFDGGQTENVDAALKQGEKMATAGALFIDVGGYSSRPGAQEVSLQEELDRVIPVVEKLTKNVCAYVSIDTFRSQVARSAVEVGAHIVNDISAGDDDPLMLETVGSLGVPYIAMHKQGVSATMQNNPKYDDVTKDVFSYLLDKRDACRNAGILDVIVDPGFGFGKTVEHNYALLRHMELFGQLNLPILVGLSRKSMIQKVLDIDAKNALNGTTFLHATALAKGASILRVHDVKEAVECVSLFEKLNGDEV